MELKNQKLFIFNSVNLAILSQVAILNSAYSFNLAKKVFKLCTFH